MEKYHMSLILLHRTEVHFDYNVELNYLGLASNWKTKLRLKFQKVTSHLWTLTKPSLVQHLSFNKGYIKRFPVLQVSG